MSSLPVDDDLLARHEPCYTGPSVKLGRTRMKPSSTKDILLSAGLAILMLLAIVAITTWLIQRIAGG